MRFLLLAILLAPSAPPQSEPDKLEAVLKKFGDRKYAMYVSGRKAGKLTMKSKIETEDGRRLVVFEDIRTETSAGGSVKTTFTEKANPDGWRLLSSRRVTDADGRKTVDLITVNGTKAAVRYDDEKRQELEISEKTVGEQALLRIVCAAEQKKGAIFSVDVLSQATGELQTRDFKCDGDSDVEIAGKKQPALRWSERGREGQPGAQVKNTYWVSSAGHLLKFIGLGGVEYVLEAK